MKSKTKTLLIEQASGQPIRAQVPIGATVTFGGLIPGAKVDGGSNRTALRIYVGKAQLAVFTGVSSFRFIDEVQVLEKRVQTAHKNVSVDEGGVLKQRVVIVTSEDWVNPDEVKDGDANQAARTQLRIETE